MQLTDPILAPILALRRTLHEIPELSGAETRTMETLKAFLRRYTTCTLHEEDGWFYARRYRSASCPTVAFRADTDAIPDACGHPFHGCGHDGHAAALAGLAYLTEQCDAALKYNLLFLFQPAEETGTGARKCAAVLANESISVIYGCHTIPGFPHGTVLWRDGVFACASRGMILQFSGRQSHAAYPDDGCNPAAAIAALVTQLPALTAETEQNGRGTVLTTVVGMQVGGQNFGVSPGSGALYLTVRAHYESALEQLVRAVSDAAHALCDPQDIGIAVSFVDEFPDTVNDPAAVHAFRSVLVSSRIPHMPLNGPMRWSEDFGHYCRRFPGVFFGIGAGEHAPPLHTDGFTFDDTLMPRILQTWLAVIGEA